MPSLSIHREDDSVVLGVGAIPDGGRFQIEHSADLQDWSAVTSWELGATRHSHHSIIHIDDYLAALTLVEAITKGLDQSAFDSLIQFLPAHSSERDDSHP